MVLYLFSQHLFFTILRETNQFLHIRKFLTGQIPPPPPSLPYRSPHWFSTKLSPILVIPLNFRQFWWLFYRKFCWFTKIFMNDFSPIFVTFSMSKMSPILWLFIEIYSDSLKFSPKLVTKKNQNQKKLFSPEMVIFLSLKNSPISSNHQNFHQNWWQKKTKSEGIIVIRIGDIFVTQKLTNFFKSPKCSPKLVKIQ